MKKRNLVYSLFLMLGLMFVLYGCSKPKATLTLDQTASTVARFESTTIKATLNNSSETITWTVSDESIVKVSVSADGKEARVDGYKVGEATVTAKAGSVEAESVITVTENSKLPSLVIKQQNVSVLKGQEKTLTTEAKFDANVLNVEVTWRSENADVVSIINGVAKGLKVGSSQITAEAEYMGEKLTAVTTVSVLENVEFSIDTYETTLYTYADVTEHKTSVTIVPVLKVDGVDGDTSKITWVSDDESVVTVSNGVITAVGRGDATVTATFVSEELQTLTNTVVVEVFVPLVETSEKAEIVYTRNTILDLTNLNVKANDVKEVFDITGDLQHKILFTVIDENTIELRVDDVLAGERTIAVYTNEVGKSLSVTMITSVITNADELDAMSRTAIEFYGTQDPEVIGDITYYPKAGGYFVLGANIDYTGHTFAPVGDWGSNGWMSVFDGVLDGRGYTITNFKVNKANGAIFAKLSETAIVKNIAFVEPQVGWAAALISVENSGLIENIYVKGNLNSGAAWCVNSLITSRFGTTAGYLKNIVVMVNKVDGTLNGAVIGDIGTWTADHFENVVVIGTLKEAGTREGNLVNLDTINSYATLDDFLASGLDLSGYTQDIWWVEAGYAPLFKNYVDVIYDAMLVSNSDLSVLVGLSGQVTHMGNFPVSYQLETAIEGITIDESGLITVDSTVTDGTIFNIVITSKLTGDTIIVPFEAKAIPINDLTSYGTMQTVELGRSDVTTFELDNSIGKALFILSGTKKIEVTADPTINGKFTVDIFPSNVPVNSPTQPPALSSHPPITRFLTGPLAKSKSAPKT